MSLEGIVKKWVAGKGFGFINTQDGTDMFVHFRQITGERNSLNIGEKVTYTIGKDSRTGRDVAVNVVGDGSGTPAIEGVQRGFGGRGGFVTRGGGRNPCFAFQKGKCNFGDTCRFSHEGSSGLGPLGYGRGISAGYGGRGMGAGQQGQAYGAGRGTGGYGGDVAQGSFSAYGAQGGTGYAQQGRGGFSHQASTNLGQQGAVMFGQQGGGGYGQQGVGGFALQGVGGGGYGQQQSAAGRNPQQSMMNSSYDQNGAGGFSQLQYSLEGSAYNQQGSGCMAAKQVPATGNYGSQQGAVGYAHNVHSQNASNNGGAYGPQMVSGPSEIPTSGYPQNF